MLVEGTYYLGELAAGSSYKVAICATASNTVTTADCTKTSSTWTGYIGLPRRGEMFSVFQEEGYLMRLNSMWLITPIETVDIEYVYSFGSGFIYASISSHYAVRPSLTLNSNVKITGGLGTENDPFELSL